MKYKNINEQKLLLSVASHILDIFMASSFLEIDPRNKIFTITPAFGKLL